MKLAYVGLGCPKNQVDLETILGGLKDRCEIIENPTKADAVIINTCSFIEQSKRESIDTIFEYLSLKEENPSLKVLVTGCLPQRYKKAVAQEIPEVDRFFMSINADTTLKDVQQFLFNDTYQRLGRFSLTTPHYAYLRIAEGCNNRCSYCAIPLIKGDFASRPLDEILNDANLLVENGAREINLIAQDITYYGRDLKSGKTLNDVLNALHDIEKIKWIRLLYTHPAHWTDEMIDALANMNKIVKYVDLPIQHISDEILSKMGRRVTRKQIEVLIEKLRKAVPDIAIRTTLITGFPGEEEHHFNELYDFIDEIKFDRLGVFTYSAEEDTRAFDMDDNVPEQIKLERQDQLMILQSDISLEKNTKMIGKTLSVLVDEISDDATAIARSQYDAPEIDNSVILKTPVNVGEFYSVKITQADVYDLFGEVL